MADIRIPWPGWEEAGRLGKGGFGKVYRIVNRFTGEESALKVISLPQDESEIDLLLAEGYDNLSIAANYKKQLDRLLNEYKLMAQMKGHPNIVRCEDYMAVAHENGIGWDVYIRMELLQPLTKYLMNLDKAQGGQAATVDLDERTVIRIGRDLCTALALCEQKKVVHRDIKPENIFVSQYMEFKLGDFGIARTMDHATNATHTGSYRYMAPEVYKNQAYDSRVDIYSLGLVLYWLLNRRRLPFVPTDHLPTALQNDAALNRRMAGHQVPPPLCGSDALKAVVIKACAYDPADRYPTARDMLEALEKAGRQIHVGTVQYPDDDGGATVYGFSGETVAAFPGGNSEWQQGDSGETAAAFSEGDKGKKGRTGETGTDKNRNGQNGTWKHETGNGQTGTGKTETGKTETGKAGTGRTGKRTPDNHLKLVESVPEFDFNNMAPGSSTNPHKLLLTIPEASAGGTKVYIGMEIIYPAWMRKSEIYSMVDKDGREVFFRVGELQLSTVHKCLVILLWVLSAAMFLLEPISGLVFAAIGLIVFPLSRRNYDSKAAINRKKPGTS